MFGAILGFLSGPITEILSTRKLKKAAQAEVMMELARAEVEAKITKVRSKALIQEKKAQAAVDWENIWANQAGTSWKDEYFTIVLSIPAMMAFIPPLQAYAVEGFIIIGAMPQWYQASLMAAIGAAFGLRALAKFTMKGK